MALTLSLSSEELNDEDLQELTTDLCKTIINETDIDAELVEGPTQGGNRGEPITLGLIALTFMNTGAAVALFKVLKSYLDRESSLVIDIQREDGTKLRIKTKNMQSEQVKDTLSEVKIFLGIKG
jgi:hypothetical protein